MVKNSLHAECKVGNREPAPILPGVQARGPGALPVALIYGCTAGKTRSPRTTPGPRRVAAELKSARGGRCAEAAATAAGRQQASCTGLRVHRDQAGRAADVFAVLRRGARLDGQAWAGPRSSWPAEPWRLDDPPWTLAWASGPRRSPATATPLGRLLER
ncbi:hypothetical protein ACRAWD_25765 [Caulobacter segnis]